MISSLCSQALAHFSLVNLIQFIVSSSLYPNTYTPYYNVILNYWSPQSLRLYFNDIFKNKIESSCVLSFICNLCKYLFIISTQHKIVLFGKSNLIVNWFVQFLVTYIFLEKDSQWGWNIGEFLTTSFIDHKTDKTKPIWYKDL